MADLITQLIFVLIVLIPTLIVFFYSQRNLRKYKTGKIFFKIPLIRRIPKIYVSKEKNPILFNLTFFCNIVIVISSFLWVSIIYERVFILRHSIFFALIPRPTYILAILAAVVLVWLSAYYLSGKKGTFSKKL